MLHNHNNIRLSRKEQMGAKEGKEKGKKTRRHCLTLPRSCFQWASSKGSNHQTVTGNWPWPEYTRTQKLHQHQVYNTSLWTCSFIPHQHLFFPISTSPFLLPPLHLTALYPPSSLFFTLFSLVVLLTVCLFYFSLKRQFHPSLSTTYVGHEFTIPEGCQW